MKPVKVKRRASFYYQQVTYAIRRVRSTERERCMSITAAGFTNIGLIRKTNEDSFGLFPQLHLYVVADGLGGHAGGEIASRMAVDMMKDYAVSADAAIKKDALLPGAIAFANRKIYDVAINDKKLSGMGTTVVAAIADPSEIIISFVGDSRAYLYQKGSIRPLTEDHSFANDYVRLGFLTPQEARDHPFRHALGRALGLRPTVEVETAKLTAHPGDLILLCTDGLSNTLTSEEMRVILAEAQGDIDKAGHDLIQRTLEKGGRDNVTVLLIGYTEG